MTADSSRDWEIDHRRPGDCARHPMSLSGIAADPDDLPHAARVLRVFGR